MKERRKPLGREAEGGLDTGHRTGRWCAAVMGRWHAGHTVGSGGLAPLHPWPSSRDSATLDKPSSHARSHKCCGHIVAPLPGRTGLVPHQPHLVLAQPRSIFEPTNTEGTKLCHSAGQPALQLVSHLPSLFMLVDTFLR